MLELVIGTYVHTRLHICIHVLLPHSMAIWIPYLHILPMNALLCKGGTVSDI